MIQVEGSSDFEAGTDAEATWGEMESGSAVSIVHAVPFSIR